AVLRCSLGRLRETRQLEDHPRALVQFGQAQRDVRTFRGQPDLGAGTDVRTTGHDGVVLAVAAEDDWRLGGCCAETTGARTRGTGTCCTGTTGATGDCARACGTRGAAGTGRAGPGGSAGAGTGSARTGTTSTRTTGTGRAARTTRARTATAERSGKAQATD